MNRPRVSLRDLFWLTLVVGLILTLVIRERQAAMAIQERRAVWEETHYGWMWSFQTLADEHEKQTGVKVFGGPTKIVIQMPDGKIARKSVGDKDWEWMQ